MGVQLFSFQTSGDFSFWTSQVSQKVFWGDWRGCSVMRKTNSKFCLWWPYQCRILILQEVCKNPKTPKLPHFFIPGHSSELGPLQGGCCPVSLQCQHFWCGGKFWTCHHPSEPQRRAQHSVQGTNSAAVPRNVPWICWDSFPHHRCPLLFLLHRKIPESLRLEKTSEIKSDLSSDFNAKFQFCFSL